MLHCPRTDAASALPLQLSSDVFVGVAILDFIQSLSLTPSHSPSASLSVSLSVSLLIAIAFPQTFVMIVVICMLRRQSARHGQYVRSISQNGASATACNLILNGCWTISVASCQST